MALMNTSFAIRLSFFLPSFLLLYHHSSLELKQNYAQCAVTKLFAVSLKLFVQR